MVAHFQQINRSNSGPHLSLGGESDIAREQYLELAILDQEHE
jgi:hypothetical protein